jgi:hypothetical protein
MYTAALKDKNELLITKDMKINDEKTTIDHLDT